MSGKATRDKGRRGAYEAKLILQERDWNIAELNSGLPTEDLLATDPEGRTWAIEVKNCMVISEQHKKQAMKNANNRKECWMLMNKIVGTSSWLIQRQGRTPVVWTKGE